MAVMNDNDKERHLVVIDVAKLKKDIEMLEREIENSREVLVQSQNNQDRRLEDLEKHLDDLQQKVEKMICKLNVIETKQENAIERILENRHSNEEFKKFMMNLRQENKNLWVPILFSTIVSVLGFILEMLL